MGTVDITSYWIVVHYTLKSRTYKLKTHIYSI